MIHFTYLFVVLFELFLVIQHIDSLVVVPILYLCDEVDAPGQRGVVVLAFDLRCLLHSSL